VVPVPRVKRTPGVGAAAVALVERGAVVVQGEWAPQDKVVRNAVSVVAMAAPELLIQFLGQRQGN